MVKLVVVEAPGKVKKFKSLLGSQYNVVASVGHVTDLDGKSMSVDIIGEHPNYRFIPKFSIKPDRKAVVSNLKKAASECDCVILATDSDREGAAISAAVAGVLGLKDPRRIMFQEITKTALMKALEEPVTIDKNLVSAQKARRVLDRLVGYTISPLLGSGKSAGRVQSAVLRLINDKNEKVNAALQDIKLHTKITGDFTQGVVGATLKTPIPDPDPDSDRQQEPSILWVASKSLDYVVEGVKVSSENKNPPPPYTTSTLQQDAASKLHLSSELAMETAQQLYQKSLITYIRTDSCTISQDAIDGIGEVIKETYGDNYFSPRTYEGKKQVNAQEAHQCIRPTNIRVSIAEDGLEKRLYDMIWQRTMASQMAAARYNVQKITLRNEDALVFEGSNRVLVFDGFLKLTGGASEGGAFVTDIKEKDVCHLQKLYSAQHLDPIPTNYSEATLIHKMEETAIGRPSTYAQSIKLLISRKYVEIKDFKGVPVEVESSTYDTKTNKMGRTTKKKVHAGEQKKRFYITPTGQEVLGFLLENFPMIVDVTFTARMEEDLDEVARGSMDWQQVCASVYASFYPTVLQLGRPTRNNSNRADDNYLGTANDGCKYSIFSGKYGLAVKCSHPDPDKPGAYICFFTSVTTPPASLEAAVEASSGHRLLGVFRKKPVWVIQNSKSIYIRHGSDKRISTKAKTLDEVTFVGAKKLC